MYDGVQSCRWARVLARQFDSTIVLLTVPEAEGEVPRLKHYLESVAVALRAIGILVKIRVTGSGTGSSVRTDRSTP